MTRHLHSVFVAGVCAASSVAGIALAAGPAPAAVAAEIATARPRMSAFTPPDLSWVARKLVQEPAYASTQVRYCLFALGNGKKSVLTFAWDESEGTGKGYDTIYADTNLNGVLGEEGERFFWNNDPGKRPDPKGPHELYIVQGVKVTGSERIYSFRFAGVYSPDVLEYDSVYKVSSPGLSYEVGPLPENLKVRWGKSLDEAPVYWFGGEPIPSVNGKHAGESLGTWKAGYSARTIVFLALHGAPAEAELRFYGSKFPSLPAAVRDNRWGKAGYPIVLLRVLDAQTGKEKEVINFGDSCPCAGGFAPTMIIPSRVPAGRHEVIVRLLRVPELGGPADFVWPVTIENPFAANLLVDPALAALKKKFPDAQFATLRRADTDAERAPLQADEIVIPTGVSDATLLPANRDWDARHANTGGDPEFYVGARIHHHADNRALLRFDLSGVPKETEIMGARLRLTLVRAGGEGAMQPQYGQSDTLEAYALRKSWNERSDNPDGWACWFGPRFRGKRNEKWDMEGADGAGTDRDEQPAAVCTGVRGYPGQDEILRLVDLDVTDLVKAWHSGKKENCGVLLKVIGNNGGFYASSEQGDYTFRPALVIAYRGARPDRPMGGGDPVRQQHAAGTPRP